jgi:hypothetical protein
LTGDDLEGALGGQVGSKIRHDGGGAVVALVIHHPQGQFTGIILIQE